MTNGTIVTLKKNTTHDVAPSAEALYQAELAINTADANIFTKRDDGVVLTQSIGTVQANYLSLSTTDEDQVLDVTDADLYRSVKYVVQATSDTAYQTIEVLIMHDGTDAYITRYGLMYTDTELATFSAYLNGSSELRFLTTPLQENVSFKWTKTLVQA